MIKRRVMVFFGALLFLTLVLFTIQTAQFGSLTGNVVSAEEPKDLELRILNFEKEGSLVLMEYQVVSDKSQELNTAYSVYNSAGETIKSGKQTIVVEESKPGKYIARTYVGEEDNLGLILSVSDGKDIVYENAKLGHSLVPITGYSVYLHGHSLSALGFTCVFLFVAGYCMWYFLQRRKVNMLSQSLDGRFISFS